jgi:hypothetical protein
MGFIFNPSLQEGGENRRELHKLLVKTLDKNMYKLFNQPPSLSRHLLGKGGSHNI